jgi:hypothetical protein
MRVMDRADGRSPVEASRQVAAASTARASGDVDAARTVLVAAFDAARAAGDTDAMAEAALAMPASQRFGVHPGQIPALLHEAYVATVDLSMRCRLAAALARSWVYGGDAVRATRFAGDAQSLAGEVGTAEATADALDAALVAHWGPDDFAERVSLAARLDDVAAHLRNPELRLSAHLWRLTTAWECLDIVAVQRQLRALELAAEESGSARSAFFAVSRRAMHALVTGDVSAADDLIARTEQAGVEVAEPDVEAVLHELRSMRALRVGDLVALATEAAAHEAFGAAEGIPSVTAVAASLWLAAGQPDRAARLAGQLMAGGVGGIARDVDFLLNVTCIVDVAAAVEMTDVAREAAVALEPYAGRGVLNAGAVTFHGVVDDYLYRAGNMLGDTDADRWRHAAQNAYRRIGARWWEQASDGPRPRASTPPRVLCLRCDDSGRWAVGNVGETATLADLKGLHYLRYLVQRPGTDVTALALSDAASDHPGTTLEVSDLGAPLDATAIASYRRRLSDLDHQLEAADQRGDQSAGEQLNAERNLVLDQLRSAAGLGGRRRHMGASTERARVAVRKAIATALTQIDQHAPDVARLLRDAVHTGVACRYDPNPDHPVSWVTD